MTDLLARLLLYLLRPVSLALAHWRFASLDRRQRRLVARVLTRRRYSRLLQIYAMPTPQQQVANYVQTTLSVGCTNVATTITVTSAAGLPTAGNFMLRIDDVPPATTFEIVEVTAVAGAVFTVTRGQEGTTGIAHNAGAFVGNDLTAAMLQRAFAWGAVGYAPAVAAQSGITTVVDVTSCTITLTTVAGRRYKITGYSEVQSTVANDIPRLTILEDGVQVAEYQITLVTANTPFGFNPQVIKTPSAASHTYKLQIVRAAGSGSLTLPLSGTNIAFILIEDIGPS
jgi:hypothetical protein